MPGTITFKPIQANLTHNTSHLMGMDPYCSITLGQTQATGEVCQKGGLNPFWKDSIILPAMQDSKCLIEIKDKSLLMQDANIGSCEVDIQEIASQGRILKWLKLDYNDQPAGEILLEASYQPETPSHLLHSSIEKQAGLGIVGMISPNTEELEQRRIEDPTEVIQGVEPSILGSEKVLKTFSQNQGQGNQTNQEFKQQNPKDYNLIRKRSSDLEVPTDRERQTRPNYENEVWGKSEENLKDIFIHNPQENLLRSVSEQSKTGYEKLQPHINDKDKYHCDHKELEGLDLTSDIGPHSSGFDKNLWSLPDNLKEMNFKSQPPK